MPKRFPLFPLFLKRLLASDAPAGTIDVAKVPMPQLSPLQWELLRRREAPDDSDHAPDWTCGT